MALDPSTEFPGQITAPSAAYPYGSARNVTSPGDNLGTPFTARLLNDVFGFQQALLDAAAITPSGDPDEVGSSQYLAALSAIISAALTAQLQSLYPVGEVYITRRTGTPDTWLGFGTWVAHGAGKTIVGLDTGDTNFNSVDDTGGSWTISRDGWGITGASLGTAASGRLITGSGSAELVESLESIRAAGNDKTHRPPYIVLYMWRRTV